MREVFHASLFAQHFVKNEDVFDPGIGVLFVAEGGNDTICGSFDLPYEFTIPWSPILLLLSGSAKRFLNDTQSDLNWNPIHLGKSFFA